MSSYLSPVIQHNDQRIFVKGSIKEKEIDFLLDTGAEITVIPTKLAQGLNIPYKKTKLCLTGVIGEDSVLYETPPIEVQFGPKTLTTKLLCAPLNTGAILGMDLLRQINLTLDMSSESTSIKISSAQISTNNATPPEYVFLQNHPIWAKDKDDCGLLTGVEPVKLTGTPPPVTKQYPINKEAIQGIKLIVENLLTQGVLVKTNSPCNSPIWPIKKSNGTWRLTIDYRVANKHIDKITPLVADPSTICNGLPLDCKIFSVIDMSNGFFSVPLHSDSQPWLAFTVDYEQYQWTRLPQGFQNSPTIYHQAVRRDLCDPECPVKQSTMIQYVDDILIASTDHEVHQTELASLLDYLHKKGHKCSFHKAQVAKKQVTFLGQTIGAGNRSITQDRAASVKAIPPPNTIKTLRSFLGTTGYCRPWIEDYASIAQPLYDLLKGHGKDSDTVCMEEFHLKAFNDLKRALCQAPALGIAQSDRPFVLYVHEHLGFMTACLMQDHGGSLRPIHYYSGKLDIVAQGMGPCLRAVQAVHLALQASSGMVLGQTVNVKCPHTVSALMNQAKVTSVTSSRWGNWLATLTAPNIVIQRAPVTNPSSCMMSAMTEFVLEDEGEMTHDCVTLTYAATSEIAETPIENAELELFVDGSAQVIEGNRRAGYAVTSTTEVVASGRLPDHFSAQAAELVALTRACTLASGSVANIYTDCIDSDQGTHFTGQVVKEVSRMLKIKWNLHCPYRPQASGQVERSNRTIKTRLSKMHQEGVPWVEALPAVLCSMRASPNRSVGLSPHEIITGRPMQMPGVIDLRNADVHIASDALIAYCENLTKAVQSAKERVESCWQTPPEGGHTIVPGQWVMIKTFKNKPLEPKWYGPHQVMLITAAAVLCQGRKTWTHVSHIKVVPPPAGIG